VNAATQNSLKSWKASFTPIFIKNQLKNSKAFLMV
jgi:hypothetical protein